MAGLRFTNEDHSDLAKIVELVKTAKDVKVTKAQEKAVEEKYKPKMEAAS